jgi:DNA-binding NarL/FixJ family response regulator
MLSSGAESAVSTGGEAKLEVIWETATPAELEAIPTDVDVLVMAAEAGPDEDLKRALIQREGRLALLLLTDDPQVAKSLLHLPLRAWGVLALDSNPDELIAAVRALHEGLLVGAPALMEPLLLRLLAAEETNPEPLLEPLTERETQVLQLLAQGLANKQIATSLAISEHTVKFHVSSVYAKLGATNRTEAVRLGVQHGLVLL